MLMLACAAVVASLDLVETRLAAGAVAVMALIPIALASRVRPRMADVSTQKRQGPTQHS
jgi:hypothetical protein